MALSSGKVSAAEIEATVQKARDEKLSEDLQWTRLMHYQKGWFGIKSDIAGRDFFLSPDGKTRPDLELEATIRALYSAEMPPLEETPQFKSEDIHPRCRFPARERWLTSALGLDPSAFAKPKCLFFENYKRRTSANAVSLVFSSYYLNSPGSAFGHTLFRLHKQKDVAATADNEPTELLDAGVGYAAEVTVENPALYAIYGLAGLFRGSFSNVPYYFKVREYNDFESRDIWSYELELSDPEVQMLVDHLWELGGTYFRYFFLTQNCAYHLLTALEAAAPRLTLASRLPSLYVIPSDSVKVLTETPGLVRRIGYRPSIRARSAASTAGLSEDERIDFEKLKETDEPKSMPPERETASKARILDAMLDYIDLKYSNEKAAIKGQMRAYKQKWLSSRASLGVPSPKTEVIAPVLERPDLGHGSSRFSVGYGEDSNFGSFTRLQMRFALHDPLDPTLGYPQGSQIEFARIDARFNANNPKVDIERVELFRAMALNPITGPDAAASWRGAFGAVRSRERSCDGCLGYGFEGGGGISLSWDASGKQKSFLYMLGEIDIRYSERFTPSRYRLLAGPTTGLILPLLANLKFQGEVGWRWPWGLDQPGFWSHSGELRWSWKDEWALSLRRSGFDLSQETSITGSYYF